MRKIVSGLFVSLDGVVESPERWNTPYFNDEIGAELGHDAARPCHVRGVRGVLVG